MVRAALPPGSINNVLVIELENEDATDTFGPGSVATYLNGTLVPKGELLENYYATGHVSLDNYIAEISGQAPTPLTDSDCNLTGYSNVTPGTDDPNTATYPGQVDGNGCVYPAPTATTNGAPTIADQLDAVYPPNPTTHVASWREYAEDMGNDPTRDGGVTDPTRWHRLRAPDRGRHGRRRRGRSDRPVRHAAQPVHVLPLHHRQHRGM